jgi:hypothetical protein
MKTIVFIPEPNVTQANEAARLMQLASHGTEGGQFSFTVPLFAVDAEDDSTPVGRWCGPWLHQNMPEAAPSYYEQAKAVVSSLGGTLWDWPDQQPPELPEQFLASLNLRRAVSLMPSV